MAPISQKLLDLNFNTVLAGITWELVEPQECRFDFSLVDAPLSGMPPLVRIGSVDEGEYRGGKWIAGRGLNGDENDNGGLWRFAPQAPSIERCVVYRYE